THRHWLSVPFKGLDRPFSGSFSRSLGREPILLSCLPNLLVWLWGLLRQLLRRRIRLAGLLECGLPLLLQLLVRWLLLGGNLLDSWSGGGKPRVSLWSASG